MDYLPDKHIIRGIIENDSRVIKEIYDEYFPMVERMIVNTGGDRERAKDVFQEAMIIIVKKLSGGDIQLTCRFSTYIYGICKRVWMQEKRKWINRMNSGNPVADRAEEPPSPAGEEENRIRKLFYRHFRELSPECRKILILHFNKVPIEEIRQILDKQNPHYIMDRKYRCKKSLINRIMSDPNFKNVKNEYSEQIRTLF